jgi:hypothetical protein
MLTMSDRTAEFTLRRLQMIDHAARLDPEVRDWLIEAQDALGEHLELECSGDRAIDGGHEHNGGTCEIHEWFDSADYAEANALLEKLRARTPA